MASDEFEHIDQGIYLTIVDGLIGSELGRRDFHQNIQQLIDDHQEIIDDLSPLEQQEYVQDLALVQEIESDFQYNYLIQETAKVRGRIGEAIGWLGSGQEFHYIEYPEAPGLDWSGPSRLAESLKRRSEKLKAAEWNGCVYKLLDTPIGEISQVGWMRNFGTFGIVQEIAELLCWTKLSRLLRRQGIMQ